MRGAGGANNASQDGHIEATRHLARVGDDAARAAVGVVVAGVCVTDLGVGVVVAGVCVTRVGVRVVAAGFVNAVSRIPADLIEPAAALHSGAEDGAGDVGAHAATSDAASLDDPATGWLLEAR